MTHHKADFSWPIRVYHEDTDAGGVVYHANYLYFMERARTEWLRYLDIEQDQLLEEHSVMFIVRHASIDYIAPARFNDQLVVSTQLTEIGRASFTLTQKMRLSSTEAILCTGAFKIVCVHHSTFRPTALPAILQSTLKKTYATV